MEKKVWIVLQAVKKQFQGVKTFQPLELGGDVNVIAVFPTKVECEIYLDKVIETVKKGIAAGTRTKDNLDPEKSLDFLIHESTLVTSTEEMIKRGWTTVPTEEMIKRGWFSK